MRRPVSIVTSVALCIVLGACSAANGTNATQDATLQTGSKAMTTLYDINNVDSSVKESGEKCMDTADHLVDKIKEYNATGSTSKQEMLTELQDLYSTLSDESSDFQTKMSTNIYDSDSSWNTDTKQYAIDVTSYLNQRSIEISEAFETAYSPASSNSNASESHSESANSESDAVSEPTNTAASSQVNQSSSNAESNTGLYDINKVDSSVKALGKEYGEFVDKYVSFMQKYESAGSTEKTSMMSDYSQMMQQYVEVMDKVDEINSEEDAFDKDTYQYWIDLYSRCSQKMLEVAS